MKKLILIVLIGINLFASDYVFNNLNDFASFVAKQNGITIVIDKNLNFPIELSVSNNVFPSVYFNMLKTILKNNGFVLVKKNKFFYIEQNKNYKTLHIVKVNSVDLDFLNQMMSFLDLNYSFNPDNNILAFKSDYRTFLYAKKLLSKIDKSFKSAKLKITIISSDFEKVKNLNFDKLKFGVPSSSKINFNFLLDPVSFVSSNSFNFDLFLKFLIKNNISNLVSNPTISLFNNKKTTFVIANNIPYETSNIVFSNNTQTVQKKFEYKDVGLELNVLPRFLSKNKVLLDLDLIFSNIVKMQFDNSKTPYTTKKQIKQKIVLQFGKKVFLSGLIQDNSTYNTTKIPLLSDVPFFGKLFRFDSKTKNKTILTIVLELLYDDNN